ncbi:transposase [Cupriavidus basilensis]|uniref:Transposase n=1 Tax=Cupriavidus basilensis TaxID=68895 RepID=A0ABT6B025_9BURK|nr:transposase [Cupriavidus basilensis]MDF3837837.1 transposase [Cupriavidus basilensis]
MAKQVRAWPRGSDPHSVPRSLTQPLQGFVCGPRKLAFPDLPAPNSSMLSRCAPELAVKLPTMYTGASMHLPVDSTGRKLCGEGKWGMRKHGYSRRHTGCMVHLLPGRDLAINPAGRVVLTMARMDQGRSAHLQKRSAARSLAL